jgi:hypothetical protein
MGCRALRLLTLFVTFACLFVCFRFIFFVIQVEGMLRGILEELHEGK